MVGLAQKLAGRASVGAWKPRRQALWLTCLMGGLFLLYVQWSPTWHIRLDENLQSDRFLHSFGHQDSESVQQEETPKHVHFIVTDSTVQRVNPMQVNVPREPALDKKKQNPIDNSISDRFQEAKNRLDKITEQKAMQDQKKTVSMRDNAQSSTGRAATPSNPGSNAAAAWSGGSFKYNRYGEPVYEHGNRQNYIPKERMVHLDLKGAPPLPSVYKRLIPWLAKYGATSILIEYEDMFPWEGPLASLAAKNHYTKEDIKMILKVCKDNYIKVIPLVQTFGHLEYVLKGSNFSYLREIPQLPQALCPSQNKSMWLVETLIDQTMALHPEAKYLHIGCDEVYQMGECEKCRLKTHETLFLDHVASTAKYVRSAHKVIPIIWHDMLTHVSDTAMKDYKFGELVEPMVWVYAEDIYRFVQPSMWSKLAGIFPYVWGASAFKGAFGEQGTVPNVRRHLDNNLNWLDVIATEDSKFSGGFRGLVLTGWQRFDHFAVLCELLPAATPSLAVNLIATSHGFFNATVQNKLYESLNCMQAPKYQTGLNLDADPFLWDKFSWCFFPGSLVFKATARLDAAKKDVRSYIDRVTLSRAWITEYNRRHNFSSPMRIDEDLAELASRLHAVTLLLKTTKEALSEWFDQWTVGEWIEQHIWPLLNELETLQKESTNMKNLLTWPVRPLPLLPQLEAYGITSSAVEKKTDELQRSPTDYHKRKLKYIQN